MPQKGEEKCVVCEDAITNPICPECLEKEVKHWLSDNHSSLIPKMRDYTGIFNTFTHDGVDCVICGSNMNVCAHCYCKEVHGFLRNQLGKDAEEFLFSFNFELMHEVG